MCETTQYEAIQNAVASAACITRDLNRISDMLDVLEAEDTGSLEFFSTLARLSDEGVKLPRPRKRRSFPTHPVRHRRHTHPVDKRKHHRVI